MTDPDLEPLLAYIREHSSYIPEVLREQLLQSGYDPATVDRAIATYQQEVQPQPEASAGSKVGRVVLGIFLGIVALAALIILVVGGFCLYVFQSG